MVFEKGIWNEQEYISYWIETEDYKKFDNIRQVSAICINDLGEILLIKNPKKNTWSLPGGTPEGDETVEETLIREVDEEASCDIEIISLLGVIEVNFPNNPNKNEGEIFHQLRFLAKIKNIKKQTIDPDKGIILDRIFVKPEIFLKFIPWTKIIGKEILYSTLKKLK